MILLVGWPFNLIIDFFADALNNLFNGLTDLLIWALERADWVYSQAAISIPRDFTKGIALSFVIAVVLKQILNIYVLEIDGDSGADPLLLIEKCAKAMLVITASNLLFQQILSWSSQFTDELIGMVFLGNESSVPYLIANTSAVVTAILFSGVGWAAVVLFAIYLVFLIVLMIKALLRSVELGIMSILFPLMACDLVTIRQERWNSFFASFIVVAFGYSIQLFLFKLSLVWITSVPTMLLSIACLYFAVSAPKWLEKFAYSSGLTQAARSGLSIALITGRR